MRRVGRPELDFDRPASIAGCSRAAAPALVVNAAAYTAVDAAEDDADAAFRANRDGPAELARLCEAAGIPLIHVSTDYVFDGLKGAPYVETDPTSPQGVYGASKLAGEQAVLAACPRAIVLRTSWVYSPTGRNFVRTMLAAGQRNPSCGWWRTRPGCPTSAPDLAEAILRLAARLTSRGWEDRYAGVYHAAGTGAASWHTSGARDVRGGGAAWAWRRRPLRRSRPTVADEGEAAAGFAARLRKARRGVRAAPAAVAGRADADGRCDLRARRVTVAGDRPCVVSEQSAWGIV